MKNEKFILDIQTKCGDIANEILNAAIDAERTFKCKWANWLIFYLHLQLTWLSNILLQFAFKTDHKKYMLIPSLQNLSRNVFMRHCSYNLSLPPISCKQLEEIKKSMLERRKTSSFVLYSHENVGQLHQVRTKLNCIK